MIRKTLIAIAATAALATVALPSAASAKKHHHHHRHGGWGVTFVTSGYDYDDCGWTWVRVGKRTYQKVWTCS
jgi:ABC-type sugar transport system substrate-binding protein